MVFILNYRFCQCESFIQMVTASVACDFCALIDGRVDMLNFGIRFVNEP